MKVRISKDGSEKSAVKPAKEIPQKGHFTKFPNAVLSAIPLHQFSQTEMEVLLVVIRKTIGFQKEQDIISRSQFVRATRRSPASIDRALRNLCTKGVLIKKRSGKSRVAWEISNNVDIWAVSLKPELSSSMKMLSASSLRKNTEKTPSQLSDTKDVRCSEEIKESEKNDFYRDVERYTKILFETYVSFFQKKYGGSPSYIVVCTAKKYFRLILQEYPEYITAGVSDNEAISHYIETLNLWMNISKLPTMKCRQWGYPIHFLYREFRKYAVGTTAYLDSGDTLSVTLRQEGE